MVDCDERDEAEAGFLDLVAAGGDMTPVLEFVEQALDPVASLVFGAVVRGGIAPVGPWRDHRLDARYLALLADRIGIAAPVRQQDLDPIGYHAEQERRSPCSPFSAALDGWAKVGRSLSMSADAGVRTVAARRCGHHGRPGLRS